MQQITKHRIRYALADFLTANIGFCIFDIIRYYTIPDALRGFHLSGFLLHTPVLLEQLLVPVVVVLLYALFGCYNRANTLYKSRLDETFTTLIVSVLVMLGVFFTALINDTIPERITNYELMATLLLSLFIPTYIARMILLTANARRVQRGDYVMDTVVIGAGKDHEARLRKIMRSANRSGMKLIAAIDIDGNAESDSILGLPIYRGDDVVELCRRLKAQAVVILPGAKGLAQITEVIERLYLLDKPLFVTPDLHGMFGLRPKISQVSAEPVVDITNARISQAAINFKRAGDIVVSALSLIVLSPVLAAIAIAVKSDSKGPVLYRQERIGLHKKPFMINKFRTMRTDAESAGPALSRENDPRITRLGHFLRKYRLDELPQFWNVLIGDMSLVGPRPEREYYIRQIIERHPAYSLIHQVRPGITSWGMVKYGYASTIDQMLERLEYDLLYIENVSLGVDLKILFYTISTVVTGKGL